MSSKAGQRAQQRRVRPTCTHAGTLWQARWKHDGAEDRRLGGCPGCGLKLEQRAPCPAQLRVGPCRDLQGPALQPVAQVAPGWSMVPAVTLPWWARAAAQLVGAAVWLLALPRRAFTWVVLQAVARRFGGRP